jgi:hypothetical protein
MDIGTVLAVGLAVLIAVLVRAAMTLADISSSLERLASSGGEARDRESAAARAHLAASADPAPERPLAAGAAPAYGDGPSETEIAAVIAVARKAMEGALGVAS